MRRKFFTNLAEKEGGKFYFRDKDIGSAIGLGVRSPNVNYIVKFLYKENEFTVLNSTGTSFCGEITCSFSSTTRPIKFKLNSISHFKNIFLRRKNRFKIKTKNENLEYFILKSQNMKKLNEISKKEAFDPTIICETNGINKITTKYHLEFDDWTQVIEPIIGLYKELIQEFESGHLNVSNKSYRKMK
jgi:hypothetical protein